MSRKKALQIKDFQYKLSRKMVYNTKANTIIVGDLDVKQMAKLKVKNGKKQKKTKQKRGINRSTQGLGFMSTDLLQQHSMKLSRNSIFPLDFDNYSHTYNCYNK
jgi:hypothetical protein